MNINWLKHEIETAIDEAGKENGFWPERDEMVECIFHHVRSKLIIELTHTFDQMKNRIMDTVEQESEIVS